MAVTMYKPTTTTWSPEDDLLLKNSIEAGASLQALAKGAVQFSRGFTLRELRDRWNSLLYDPQLSTDAASRINELDLSSSNSAASKINRSENAKSAGKNPKRKIVSIRRQYNLKRKKLRTELFNSSDIGFLEPNLHDCNGHAGDIQDHLTLDNGPGGTNCMLRDSISDHFGLQESDFDIYHQVFPPEAGDVGTATVVEDAGNGYQTQCSNLIGGNHCMSNAMEDNLYGLPENVPPLLGDNGRGSFETDTGDKTVSHMLADDSVNFGNFANPNTHDSLQELSNNKHLDADDSAVKRLPDFHAMTENPQSTSSGFAGRHINSPDSDGTITLHTMGFSSPMTRLPLWKTMEDISVPAMPVHMHSDEMTHGVEESLALPENKQRGKSLSGFDAVHSNPLLMDRDDNGNFYSSGAASEGEFADISDALLDFPTEDELFFMNVDGKDKTDKSCCENTSSLIISSSGDAQEGGICDTELIKSNNIELCTTYLSTACHGNSSSCAMESKNIISSLHDDGQQSITPSEINIASKFLLPDSSQLIEENICCTLNTEDTEIPCNDDIFLLIHPTTSFAPARNLYTTDPNDSVSSADEKDNDRGINLTKAKDSALSHAWSVGIGPKKLSDSFPSLPIAGCKVKSEVLDTKNFNLQPGEVRKTILDLSQNRSAVSTSALTADGLMEQDVMKVEPRVSNNQGTASREMDLIAEAGLVKTALPADNPSASDQEEAESENDVPYFSDVEAMILEMDLGPQDQYSQSTRKVSKYQNADAKKRIIRLEQCARSSLQRMMSSHGAFALLYGRHLKHYINKTEVLLGRSTDDVNVDIDLRQEGRANKISRRQATIKMEANGSFFLKNLGKSSLSVNGREVASEQSVRLGSGFLIEIKGMSFVFEINQKYVSQYLDTVSKKNQYKNNKFGSSPGHKV